MRVAVFRAAADGRRTAARLAARGHEAVPAPVLEIVATGALPQADAADGLIFTSAHAPDRLASLPGNLIALRDLPCWCVGAQTAAAARDAGFRRLSVGDGYAARLAPAVIAAGPSLRWTLVAGRDRKPMLERLLLSAGVALTVVEAYAAEAAPPWSAATASALAAAEAALHYSARSATLAMESADAAGLGARFHGWTHHCLSHDVASTLRGAGIPCLRVAARPDEPSLLATLDG